MQALFFSKPSEFRQWLAENHLKETELYVGFYKVSSGKPTMTWSQAVDQALCFGWIDGVRKSLGTDSYCNRFTPRRPTSNWSTINIQKVKQLAEQGLMQPSGWEAYSKRKEEKSGIYSFENKPKALPVDLMNKFKANKAAWDFFSSQAPSYQKTIVHWIISAKQEKTRMARLDKTLLESEKQKRLF